MDTKKPYNAAQIAWETAKTAHYRTPGGLNKAELLAHFENNLQKLIKSGSNVVGHAMKMTPEATKHANTVRKMLGGALNSLNSADFVLPASTVEDAMDKVQQTMFPRMKPRRTRTGA